jgi:putative protease
MPLEPAQNQPLDSQRLASQLGRLGGTSFRLGKLVNLLVGRVLVPVSELNRLRRDAVAQLETLRRKPPIWTLREQGSVQEPGNEELPSAPGESFRGPAESGLVVLVRNEAQLKAVLAAGIRTVYCEFEDPKKYRSAVTLFREWVQSHSAADHSGLEKPSIWLAPPRIFKMGEDWVLKQVRSAEADGYLVRNYDHLHWFAGERRIGDYSLNIANRFAASYFLEQFGLERVTASYDLNFQQLEALLRGAGAERFEVTVHQHMPMFHMEHCVFCAFLTKGIDYRDCGRPCDTRELKLRDRVGAEHPVKADAGCRNTVFNSLAQTGAEGVSRMLALGLRRFRIEFLDESPELVSRVIGRYRQLLKGEITGQQLWKEFRFLNQLGVTRGQLGG